MRGFKIERPSTAFTPSSRHRRPRQRASLHLKWVRTFGARLVANAERCTPLISEPLHRVAASSQRGSLKKPDDSWTTPLCLAHRLLGEDAAPG